MGAVMRLVSRLVSRCWMTALVLSAGLAAGDAQAALQGRAVPTNGDPLAIESGEGPLLPLDRAMALAFTATLDIARVTAKAERPPSIDAQTFANKTPLPLTRNSPSLAHPPLPTPHPPDK